MNYLEIRVLWNPGGGKVKFFIMEVSEHQKPVLKMFLDTYFRAFYYYYYCDYRFKTMKCALLGKSHEGLYLHYENR